MMIERFFEPIQTPRAVLSFTGWSDAAELIRHSLEELKMIAPWQQAASRDLDGFWHLDAIRPQVRIQHGQLHRLEWPCYQFYAAELAPSVPVLIGTGPEPTCNWRRFAATLLKLLQEW
jgi:hypothetical protein